jgi:hypothetical protein
MDLVMMASLMNDDAFWLIAGYDVTTQDLYLLNV